MAVNEISPVPQFSLINRRRFDSLEKRIDSGLRTFYEVGAALKEIRDSRAYKKHLGFETFEDYCRERWGIDSSHARYHIMSSVVVDNLKCGHGHTLPANVRQCRPLIKLEPEQQIEAWKTVVERAEGNGGITAKLVTDVVGELLGDNGPAAWTLDEAMMHLRRAIESHVDRWPREYIEVMQHQLVDLAAIIPNFVGDVNGND
jgi:hypothetical protein